VHQAVSPSVIDSSGLGTVSSPLLPYFGMWKTTTWPSSPGTGLRSTTQPSRMWTL